MRWLLCFGVGWYPEGNWGTRKLGKGRYALDLWKLSFRVEFLDYR